MKDLMRIDMSLAVALASLVVHTDEMLHEPNPSSADFDRNTILSLLQSVDIATWLESFPPGLLPQKRDPTRGLLVRVTRDTQTGEES